MYTLSELMFVIAAMYLITAIKVCFIEMIATLINTKVLIKGITIIQYCIAMSFVVTILYLYWTK